MAAESADPEDDLNVVVSSYPINYEKSLLDSLVETVEKVEEFDETDLGKIKSVLTCVNYSMS